MDNYVIGLDFGTDSVRALIVNTRNGQEMSSAVFEYPRWKQGMYCNAPNNQFRQHPKDYIEGLEQSIKKALQQASPEVAQHIVAISVDTTGSTPVAIDKNGTPLALTPGFEENPNAMFVLWKDHTAIAEAEEINTISRTWGGEDFTKYVGGIYSSEWFWAKITHVVRTDAKVAEAAYSWVEHCDWIPALLSGKTKPEDLKRSRCAAGHKAMWHSKFNGLPSEEFLVKLEPKLKGLRERLYSETFTCDVKIGTITPEWAAKLGINQNTAIAAGSFDAHLGALGGEIKPYHLVKIMGTSTCDILVAPTSEVGDKLVRGICGQVDGSVIPGMLGLEAGQSAFGDIYAWFKNLILGPTLQIIADMKNIDESIREKLSNEIVEKIIPVLSEQAAQLPIEQSGEIALDWMNGRRTPDANQNLKGIIAGINLGSDAARVFRALVEATAFGAKRIVDRFKEEGIPIEGIIGIGGVAKKSPYVMQVLADVLDMPIRIARSEQACALGAAIAAAVAGGIYPSLDIAQKAMGGGFETTYQPIKANVEKYKLRYSKYLGLGQYFETYYI